MLFIFAEKLNVNLKPEGSKIQVDQGELAGGKTLIAECNSDLVDMKKEIYFPTVSQ